MAKCSLRLSETPIKGRDNDPKNAPDEKGEENECRIWPMRSLRLFVEQEMSIMRPGRSRHTMWLRTYPSLTLLSETPMSDLRDHSQPCEHTPDDYTKVWGDEFHIGHYYQWAPAHGAWCPGGRKVTDDDILAMASKGIAGVIVNRTLRDAADQRHR